MSGHTFHPAQRQTFFEELSSLAKEMKCHGPIKGNPPLPAAKSSTLSLNKILRIQLMMSPADRMKLSLELGANPKFKTNGISQLDLAKAFAKVYRDDEMVELLKSYGATAVKKHRNKKST